MENFSAKQMIIQEGTDNTTFYIVAGGSVTASVSGHEIVLKKEILSVFLTLPPPFIHILIPQPRIVH